MRSKLKKIFNAAALSMALAAALPALTADEQAPRRHILTEATY